MNPLQSTKRFVAIALGACALFFTATAASAQCCSSDAGATLTAKTDEACCGSADKKAAASEGQVARIALIFHADWCGNCKVLEPTIAAAREKLEADDVLFVTLDFTDDQTRAQAELLAKALGLGEILAEQGGRPGMLLVVDGKEKKVLDTFTRQHDAEAIYAGLSR